MTVLARQGGADAEKFLRRLLTMHSRLPQSLERTGDGER